MKTLAKNENSGKTINEVKNELKLHWKEKLKNSMSSDEFKDVWKQVKMNVQDAINDNPQKHLWFPGYEVQEDDDSEWIGKRGL